MGVCRPQGGLDVVGRDGVAAERFAGEALDEGMRVFGEEAGYRRMKRRAAVGIGRNFPQMRRDFFDEADGRWAAQNARRDAAAEGRMSRLARELDVHGAASSTVVITSRCVAREFEATASSGTMVATSFG